MLLFWIHVGFVLVFWVFFYKFGNCMKQIHLSFLLTAGYVNWVANMINVPWICIHYFFTVWISMWKWIYVLPVTFHKKGAAAKMSSRRTFNDSSTRRLLSPWLNIPLMYGMGVVGHYCLMWHDWRTGSSTCLTLTHWGWATHICISKLGYHCFGYWFVSSVPSHYLDQSLFAINRTPGKELQ